jgi:hypothetical protein
LPFRRFCPRWLNFPALIFGSLVPDLSYCIPRPELDHFAHTFVGSFGFSLPVGIASVGVFYWLRSPFVRLLPERFRKPFLPLCERPAGPLWVLILSVLVGSWTHIAIDSVSHNNGWLVEQMPSLRESVGLFFGHRMTLYQICWFAFTFLGVAWLSVAYLKWFKEATGTTHLGTRQVRTGYAVVMALLTVLLGLVHRLAHHPLELYPIVAGMVVLAAAFVVGVGLRLGK